MDDSQSAISKHSEVVEVVPEVQVAPIETFGSALLDSLGAIETFGQEGLDGLIRCSEYLKKRASIEEDYAKSLMKLDKSFNFDKTKSLANYGLYSLFQCDEYVSQSHHKLALQMETAISESFKMNAKEYDKGRKEALCSIRNLKGEWKKSLDLFDKYCKVKESTARQADDARIIFEKANSDKNMTKGQIEKFRDDFSAKAVKAMNAKDDYLNILEETKVKLNTFYTIDLPAAFDKLQQVEFDRLSATKKSLKQLSEGVQNCFAVATDAIKLTNDHFESINAEEEIKLFISMSKPSAPFKIPSLVIPESPVKATFNVPDSKALFKNKSKENPEKLKKRAATEIKKIDKDLQDLEKQKSGVEILMAIYQQQPQFTDSKNRMDMQEQLDELSRKIGYLMLQREEWSEILDSPSASQRKEEGGRKEEGSLRKEGSLRNEGSIRKEGSLKKEEDSLLDDEIPTQPISVQVKLIALYDFEAQESIELSLRENEELLLIEKEGDWWKASNMEGKVGYVPFNYVQEIQ